VRGFDFTGRPSEGAASGAPTKATAKITANADPSPLKRVRDDS